MGSESGSLCRRAKAPKPTLSSGVFAGATGGQVHEGPTSLSWATSLTPVYPVFIRSMVRREKETISTAPWR